MLAVLAMAGGAQAGAPITGAQLSGSSAVTSGTFAIQNGATVTSATGATINIASGTVTLPSDVTRLGSTIELDGGEVANTLPWASLNKTGSSLGDLATANATDLTFEDGITITFNPDGTNAGLNVGSHTSDPSSAANGDIWYNSTSNELKFVASGTTYVVGSGTGGGSSTFLGLTDTPSSFAGNGTLAVRVNSGETALEFFTIVHDATAIQGSDVQSGSPSDGQILMYDGTTDNRWEWVYPTAYPTAFTGLSDVPSSYSGQANKVVAVNSGETALEFITASSATFAGLTDTPSSYSGQSLKSVRVNSGETALEFYTPSGGSGTLTYGVWTAMDGQPPASNYATLDTRNSIAVLDFDASTDEAAVFVGVVPEGASLGSGLKAIVKWAATSATSGNVVWGVQFEAEGTDIDSDSFDTAATATGAANGTSGIPTSTTITNTNIDSVTEGKLIRMKIYRDADNGSDTMTGDAELIAVELRSGT